MNPENAHLSQNEQIPVAMEQQEIATPIIDPGTKIIELNETITTHTDSIQETQNEVQKLRAELGLGGEVEIPSVQIAQQQVEKLTNEKNALEGEKTQEGFAENNILNPDILSKLAELESIDETGQSNPSKYQSFLEFQKKAGDMSVEANQSRLQEIIDMGDTPESYDYTDTTIYGVGGMNRYSADEHGTIRLLRGATITSGTEEYKTALESKAKELGFIVG